jgi:pimeloyl-ACP methyl ester carboxylesterase
MSVKSVCAGVAVAVTLAVAPGAASAAVPAKTTTLPGFAAPGTPAKYNRVFVTKYGPKKPDRILVLIPGTSGGAGNFAVVAPELVKRVPGLGVWAIDRRSEALEDTSMFRKLLAGKATDQQAIDYYLGWIGNPKITNHFQPVKDDDVQFAKDWGLDVSIEDVRRVVTAARKASGRKVILGGHSLGGSTTTAYAVWDFAGKAAWKDLDGLMLIDGGGASTAAAPDLATREADLATLRAAKSPWLDLLGVGLPWSTGVFVELGAVACRERPQAVSPVASLALLPAQFKPAFPVTNCAQLGFAMDETTSPAALGLIHVRAGALATSGSPRRWVDGEVTPIENVAEAFGREPANGAEWYFPKRLSFDLTTMANLEPSAATEAMGLHPKHARDVKLPVYAIQTSLSGGALATRTRAFVAMNGSKLTFVDASKTNSHLDPLLAAPKTSAFLESAVPWLKKVAR